MTFLDLLSIACTLALYGMLIAWLWPRNTVDPRPPWIERGKHWRGR